MSTVPPAGAVALPALLLARAAHTASPLPDGRVLVAGGCTSDGCGGVEAGGKTELYEPACRRFVPGPTMLQARAGHTATPLADGRVLFVGGYPGEGQAPLASAELYDPRTNRFVATGPMRQGRGAHTATRLRDGRVQVVGGVDGVTALSTVEIFDPANGVFQLAASMPGARATHSAAMLADGRVLVAGGQTRAGRDLGLTDTALVYDPGANTWRGAGRLQQAKFKLALAALPGGGALSDAVVRLADGRVVVSGGRGVEIYADGRLSSVVAATGVERQFPASAPLPDGSVIVTGGYDQRIRVSASAILVPLKPE